MFEVGAGHGSVYEDAGSLAELQQLTSNRQYRHHPGLPTTKIMLAPEPPGLSPLEAIYMDEQLRFYESDNGKNALAYCNLEPIGLEPDQMPPSTPHDLLQSSHRQFTFEDIAELEAEKPFQMKPPQLWESCDIIDWIFNWAGEHRVDLLDINTLNFNTLTGQDICSMSRSEFCSLDAQYGSSLYDTLQFLLASYGANLEPEMNPQHTQTLLPSDHMIEDIEYARERDRVRYNSIFVEERAQGLSPSGYSGCDSDRESASSSMTTVNERSDLGLLYNHQAKVLSKPATNPFIKRVGRRGRPPKKDGKLRSKQGKGTGKLWEFIRDLLLDPATCPSMIRWERREDGIFKFIQSDKVARLWGDRKQNPRMTYEKLSRAMRYYYKSQVLLPVFGRRLVYKFGPNATGWRPMLHPNQPM